MAPDPVSAPTLPHLPPIGELSEHAREGVDHSGMTGIRLLRTLKGALPTGRTLPAREWERRHRALVALLWAHAVVVPIYGLLRGYGGLHGIGHALPLIGFAGLAMLDMWSRRLRAIFVVMGLLTASALVVHASHGLTEAHFHFFVIIVVLTIYEDWLAFLLAVGFVVLHHGALGVINREAVFAHGGNPWAWAGIHGAFVLAAGVAAIAGWRLNEDVRTAAGEVEERFRSAFDDAAIGMALVSPGGGYLQVNRALCDLTGYSEAQLLERGPRGITHPDDLGSDSEALRKLSIGEMRTYASEKRYVHAQGHVVWVALNASAVHTPDGGMTYFVAQMQDITERRRAEAKLAHQAMHDPLTGLPNRALFMDRLAHGLRRLERKLWPLTVMFVDLDRFKQVNDSLGHPVGDELLRQVAYRLRDQVRSGDTVARIAGDEFTILCEDLTDAAEADALASRLVAALREPFLISGHEIYVAGSVGITVVNSGDGDPDLVVGQADAAMYRAKELGGGRFERFQETMRRTADRFELENALRLAVERDELLLHYQTEVSLETGKITAVEALVRWQHPERGLVPPDEFIPAAERTGVIVELGAWVLDEACRQLAAWNASGVFDDEVRIAVNVSAVQLVKGDMVEVISRTLQAHGLSPERLCLEVTESALMDGAGCAIDNLRRIKELGVHLAIDDFGTGFSSLARIKELPPIDLVKIDRSFVSGLGVSLSDSAIVSSVLNLAVSLGVPAIAEGVETLDQVEQLRGMGCPLGQGYLFGRPLPADQVTAAAMLVS
jgi:diguanylate cyclase (GGDEF)-like protein/PAS domain S-box-containing protein